ncbi:hypothetical protein ACM0JF_02995 [Mycoplasma sp. 654]|uniref:hypothetical protein n=1 Tax=Mycoplasma sp. 654 TaxID=3398773 RepID=UPI003A8BF3C8
MSIFVVSGIRILKSKNDLFTEFLYRITEKYLSLNHKYTRDFSILKMQEAKNRKTNNIKQELLKNVLLDALWLNSQNIKYLLQFCKNIIFLTILVD